MKSDLLLAVTQLAAERKLPHSVVVSAIEAALASAYKRDPAAGGQDVVVQVDPGDGDVTVKTVIHVVDEVEEPGAEVTVADAQKIQLGAQLGDVLETGFIDHNPGRIAAQTAKQVVMQRLREAERDLVFDEYVDKAGELLTGTIQRIDPRYITVDLGRAEAIMPPSEQAQFERYRPGQQLKFYILDVARTVRGPEIVVSRTHPELLKRLFEVEVPEIFNGIIEIKSIAREAGSRSKVAVNSTQAGVDAVGACVGLRGIRIQNVVNELLGEKIDVIEWDRDLTRFIANSLSPANVDHVEINDDEGSAVVIVPDRVLSLAIGREGQNARLAAKLTGWHIDIRGATQAAMAAAAEAEAAAAAAAAAAPEPEPEPEPELVEVAATAEELVVAEQPVEEAVAAEIEQQQVEPVMEPVSLEEPAPALDETAIPAGMDSADVPELEISEEEAGADEEELALLALEEELAALEREEAERREAAAAAVTVDFSSDDLWQADFPAPEEDEGVGVIRFAEDIAGFREEGEGRRRRGGGGRARRRR